LLQKTKKGERSLTKFLLDILENVSTFPFEEGHG